MSRPIGFWLKLVDRLIDERFEATLSAHGVTRRQWQLLNVLGPEPTPLTELDTAVRPFLSGSDGESSVSHLAGLVEDGWVEPVGHTAYRLTARGAVAHADLAEIVAATRRQTAAGVDLAAYATTEAVLERMAGNLGWVDSAP